LSLIFDDHPVKMDPDLDEIWDQFRERLETEDLVPKEPYTEYLESVGLLETHVEDYLRRVEEHHATFSTPLPNEAYIDNWIGRKAMDFIDEAPKDEPWYLVVNFAGPHEPWDVTRDMHSLYRNPDIDLGEPALSDGELSRAKHQEIRRNYAAMIENIDRWLGDFLAHTQRRGERDETLVVFGSDHGEMLGDHSCWGKCEPYQSSVGVPLVIEGPDVPPTGLVDDVASVIDLHSTFLDYAGVEPKDVDSRSLRPFITGETPEHRNIVQSGLDTWRLAFDGRYKMVQGYEGTDQTLFDLVTDPEESQHVAADNPNELDRLESYLQTH
jgi:arylsulfatase A-like enzyme